MATTYAKKLTTKIPSPKKGTGFSRAANPKTSGLKRTYAKSTLGLDPAAFGGFGFGDTGLAETPSIIGMGQPSRRGSGK
jgi:hypothetical protein